MDKYVVKAKVDQLGQKLSINIHNKGQNSELKDLRIEKYMQGLHPISTKQNAMLNIIQKLALQGAPLYAQLSGG